MVGLSGDVQDGAVLAVVWVFATGRDVRIAVEHWVGVEKGHSLDLPLEATAHLVKANAQGQVESALGRSILISPAQATAGSTEDRVIERDATASEREVPVGFGGGSSKDKSKPQGKRSESHCGGMNRESMVGLDDGTDLVLRLGNARGETEGSSFCR